MSTGECLGLIDRKAREERSSSRRSDAIENDFVTSASVLPFEVGAKKEKNSEQSIGAVGIGENGSSCGQRENACQNDPNWGALY